MPDTDTPAVQQLKTDSKQESQFVNWALHFLYGAIASTWNGLWSSAYVAFGASGAEAAGMVDLKGITLSGFMSTILGTILFHLSIYFYNHRIPDDYPSLKAAMRASSPSGPVKVIPAPTPVAAVALISIFAMLFGLVGCMSPTQTTPDINFWSYSGDANGSLFLTNPDNPAGLQLRQGPLPVYVIHGININLTDSSQYNDVLKFSHAQNILVDGPTVVHTGGNQKEQAIDMNNLCSNITFSSTVDLQEGLQNVWTIKGGCTQIHADTLTITSGTGDCDLELGGVSAQQPDARTTGVSFGDITQTNGKPVQIRVWGSKADSPTVQSGSVVITTIHL